MRRRIGDIANGPNIEGVILKDLVGPIAFDGGAVAIVLSVFEHLVVQGPLGIQEKMTEVVHIIDQALTGTAEFKLLAGIVDGRDRAIDSRKLKNELGWEPSLQFEEGIEKTVRWYLENQEWMDHITSGEYEKYYESMYKNR